MRNGVGGGLRGEPAGRWSMPIEERRSAMVDLRTRATLGAAALAAIAILPCFDRAAVAQAKVPASAEWTIGS